jgi:hypothetical protein
MRKFKNETVVTETATDNSISKSDRRNFHKEHENRQISSFLSNSSCDNCLFSSSKTKIQQHNKPETEESKININASQYQKHDQESLFFPQLGYTVPNR